MAPFPDVRGLLSAAGGLGVRLMVERVREAMRFEAVSQGWEHQRVEAMLLQSSLPQQPGIPLALRHGLPSVAFIRYFATLGDLLAYAADMQETACLSTGQADRILRGTPPAQLPVQQNARFELLINRRTAAALPIVFFGNFDPLATGLVASLARPGNNLSGVLIAVDGTLAAKKLELLKEAAPRATRIVFLSPDDPAMQVQIAETRQAAAGLGLELSVVTVRGADYPGAFAAITAERAQAVFVGAQTTFMTDRKLIIDLARRNKLPTIWEWPEQVRDGGLMAYGTSLTALYERVAGYIDRIFKGARVGDLPIEQPTTFGLVLNWATAKAIGLSLPRPLLLRADEVVE
jgi:putative ABC transport system substrate-binding protein